MGRGALAFEAVLAFIDDPGSPVEMVPASALRAALDGWAAGSSSWTNPATGATRAVGDDVRARLRALIGGG